MRYWEKAVAVRASAAPVSTALALIDHGAAHVTPSRGNAYAGPFPLRPCLPFAPLQPAGLHRPRWRLAALSAIYPRVFTAVHIGALGSRESISTLPRTLQMTYGPKAYGQS